MKIDKFNEMSITKKLRDFMVKSPTEVISNEADKLYPFKCKFKNRIPDPGECWIIEINFEERNLTCSNGRYRYLPGFDDVEFIPDLFLLNKYNL